MGCMCSKAVARSMSIREELNYGFQSTAVAWEELITSHTGNDQLFAFVRSANNSTNKLRASNFVLPPEADPETASETKSLANAWDLIQEFQREKEDDLTKRGVAELEPGRFTRSKSCQMFRQQEQSETDGRILNENKLDWRDKTMRGSRSFHTVEEFDALLERIHRTSSTSKGSVQDYYSFGDVKSEVASNSLAGDRNDGGTPRKEAGATEALTINMDNFKSVDTGGSTPETGWRRKAVDNFKVVDTGESTPEKGWRRRAMAKGLRSLDVPSVEFPVIGRRRQWMQVEEGQVFSPGTYVTPKFGSYNHNKRIIPAAAREEKGTENSAFIPELVATLEDCMQQLKVEEEMILSHMDEYLPPMTELHNQDAEKRGVLTTE